MGLTILFVPLLLIVASEVSLSLGLELPSIYVSVYEGMDSELRCPPDSSNGSTVKEGEFMWSYEQDGIWQAVAIRKGATLQQSFREKMYEQDIEKETLSNNKTINEKFYGRVNISRDGKLILMNSTVNDSGNYKCSYKGFKDKGLPRESVVNLSVKPFQVERPTTESKAKSKEPSGVESPTTEPNAKSNAPSGGYFLAMMVPAFAAIGSVEMVTIY